MSAFERLDRGNVGLTLLEVLAATMIFAMVMSVLIGTSTTAVHRIGLSSRQLEASLIADRILADLEIQFKQKIVPVVDDDEESIEGIFSIRVVSEGFPQILARKGGFGMIPVSKYLKRFDILVTWIEPHGVETIARTTFAYDWQAAAAEFSDLFGSPGGPDATDPKNGDSIEQTNRGRRP